MVLAREIERHPKVLLVGQPTRGVDIGAIEFIHRRLIALRDAGVGILLVSVELDEIMNLSDRILDHVRRADYRRTQSIRSGRAGSRPAHGRRQRGGRMMQPRLTFVTLGVCDLARSRAFYEAWGWKASSASQPEVAFFQANGLALALWGRAESGQGCRAWQI